MPGAPAGGLHGVGSGGEPARLGAAPVRAEAAVEAAGTPAARRPGSSMCQARCPTTHHKVNTEAQVDRFKAPQ